jgi:hypothetical protein
MRSQLQVLGNLVKVDAAGKVNIDGLADALLSNNNFANKLANKTGLNVKFKRNSTEPDNKNTINITPSSAEINLLLTDTTSFSATTSDGSGVTWSSSDSSIAEVDSSGNVTAKAIGNCSITAKSNNGGSVSASVRVYEDEGELPDYVYMRTRDFFGTGDTPTEWGSWVKCEKRANTNNVYQGSYFYYGGPARIIGGWMAGQLSSAGKTLYGTYNLFADIVSYSETESRWEVVGKDYPVIVQVKPAADSPDPEVPGE